jgi:hypothetical protein
MHPRSMGVEGESVPSRKVIECRIATALLYVVMGAVSNVGVAWWSASLTTPSGLGPVAVTPSDPEAFETVEEAVDELVAGWPWADGRPIRALAYEPLEQRSGWPLASMRCTWPNRHRVSEVPYVIDGLPLAPLEEGVHLRPRALPLEPLWASFILDTVFYASLLGALTLSAMLAGRGARRRAARCPRCGATRCGAPACTQCGWCFAILSAEPVTARPALPWYN